MSQHVLRLPVCRGRCDEGVFPWFGCCVQVGGPCTSCGRYHGPCVITVYRVPDPHSLDDRSASMDLVHQCKLIIRPPSFRPHRLNGFLVRDNADLPLSVPHAILAGTLYVRESYDERVPYARWRVLEPYSFGSGLRERHTGKPSLRGRWWTSRAGTSGWESVPPIEFRI